MRTHLDFLTTLPHSEDIEATMEVSITNYSDGPKMRVTIEGKCVTLTRSDIHALINTLNNYDNAIQIMEGQKL